MNIKNPLFAAVLSTLLSAGAVAAPDYQPGNILVSSQNTVFEYAATGELVSQFSIPNNPAAENSARDIIVLDNGNLAVFNGTFEPVLSIYDGEAWAHHTIDGWSTVNNGSYGGIDTLSGNVLLADMSTANAITQGLLLVDLQANQASSFVDNTSYIDVTVGQDGLIYALKNSYGNVDVYDPDTLQVIKSVDLGHLSSSRGVTANAQGEIFMVSWDEYIARYSADGILQKKLTIETQTADPQDINIDDSGRIAVGSRFGTVFITDESLNRYTSIEVTGANAFVAFVPEFEPSIAPPQLTGSYTEQGKWVVTTLNWQTEAAAVDVYFNGTLLETVTGSSVTYQHNKRTDQRYYVCNAGTQDCSDLYTVNVDGGGNDGGGKGGNGKGGKK